jgi:rhodanese-related sulfurtransferase
MTKYVVPTVLLILIAVACGAAQTDNSHALTVQQLLPMLGKPDVIIIDVRTNYDWDNSKVKIEGAVREEGMKFGSWMKKYPKDKTLVLYCDCVNDSTSSSLTQLYVKEGYEKVYFLKGATVHGAWKDWVKSKYPTVPK